MDITVKQTLLGDGGFSKVYLVEEYTFNERVNIKRYVRKVSTDKDYDMEKEWKMSLLLNGIENIPKSLNYGQDNKGNDYIDFEYISNTECLFDVTITNDEEAFYICHEITKTLNKVHALGIVHRDIKRENVLYDRKNKKVWIIDWGSASNQFYSRNTSPTSKIEDVYDENYYGTFQINPPEFFNGGFQDYRKVDVWHVSILLYELLTKSDAFNCKSSYDRIERIKSCKWNKTKVADEKYIELFNNCFTSQDKRKSMNDLEMELTHLRTGFLKF